MWFFKGWVSYYYYYRFADSNDFERLSFVIVIRQGERNSVCGSLNGGCPIIFICVLLFADLRRIYQSLTVEEAEGELAAFARKWDAQYPAISPAWYRHWPNLITLFDYPDEIRKVIYTTNAIESLNSVIRKAIKNRKIFPHDQSALKVVYLAVEAASQKWTMPIHHWKRALNRFIIEFPERMPENV